MTSIIIYTDGSFSKKKGKTYCGYGIHFPNKEHNDVSRSFIHSPLTNQRSELYAIYKALKITNKKYDKIIIYSDSQYSIKCVTEWIDAWIANDWQTSSGAEVKNQDIIINIHNLMLKNNVEFHHVRSHTGKQDSHSLGNAKADALATAGAAL